MELLNEYQVADGSLAIGLTYSERFNFSFYHNAIPVITRLELCNRTTVSWKYLKVTLELSPGVASPVTLEVSDLEKGAERIFSTIEFPLRYDLLRSMTEKSRGEILLKVEGKTSAGEETISIAEMICPIEVYAWDEWTGLTGLPEILAAFVTPNAGESEKLLIKASDLLQQRTGDSSLSGYQSESKERVYLTLAAIYDAARSLNIRYSAPPASFEENGQRVRFMEHILKSEFATCLDISLMFASLIEQAGLRPILLLHKGHCYVGCWLVEESFAEPAVDDLQSIRKRVELESIVVFEATAALGGTKVGLRDAERQAEGHLKLDDVFAFCIDVARARKSGILPIPLTDEEVDDEEGKELNKENVTSSSNGRTFQEKLVVDGTEETPQTRVDKWKQQLLDLSLRNRLLNFRETKQTIPIACPELGAFEDALAADRTFKVLPESEIMSGNDPRDLSLLMRRTQENPIVEHLKDELKSRRLRVPLGENELTKRILQLYRKTNLEMEESGVNTLFLALGFLEWSETDKASVTHRAPILLVPVKLIRKSVIEGFVLARADEDTIVNVTLLEMIRRDFGKEIPGVDPPPMDDSGVDVVKTLRIFSEAIVDMTGWELHPDAWLGRFSFSKFLLWKDLQDRIGDLMESPVVNHLINKAGQPFEQDIDEVLPEQLDKELKPEDLFCPLSADSSQLAAIVASARGKSFVLHGPPGTGKSQTIANLISHNLAIGRTVLFVAEKRAALEVVHDRLSKIGLGEFCLELHSNKTGKAEALRQFEEAIKIGELHTPDEWQITVNKLQRIRKNLNAYAKELHRPGPGGLTAFQNYCYLIKNSANEINDYPIVEFAFSELGSHDRETLERLREVCEQVGTRASRLSAETYDSLKPIKESRWTPEWETKAIKETKALAESLTKVKKSFYELTELLNVEITPSSLEDAYHFIQLASYLRKALRVPEEFFASGWKAFSNEVRNNLLEQAHIISNSTAALSDFNLQLLEPLQMQKMEAMHSLLSKKDDIFTRLRRWWNLRPLVKARILGSAGWDSSNVNDVFGQYNSLKDAEKIIDQNSSMARERLGHYWKNADTDWDEVEEILKFGDRVHAELTALADGRPDKLNHLVSSITPLLADPEIYLSQDSKQYKGIVELVKDWTSFMDSYEAATETFALGKQLVLPGKDVFEKFSGLCKSITDHSKDLRAWCHWQHSCSRAQELELGPLIEEIEKQNLKPAEAEIVFERSYRQACLRYLTNTVEALRDFWSDEFEKQIQQFADLDEVYLNLSSKVARARIAGELPKARLQKAIPNSELGVLQRECAKKRRHKPTRKLMQEISTLLPKIKPCFLMSPLSVAQYLDAGHARFDMVVFDEASQITVWDAIGAMARAKQVVVVGDPKQLPPTNFFNRVETDEFAIDDGICDDLESILDECIGAGLPSYHLDWHYRSRNEQLIAFSNHHYYGDRLLTFPSADTNKRGVNWHHVKGGVYDRGRTRTNRAEAEAVVKEVVTRLSDENQCHQSIGIVTFSQVQQDLIENLLEDARRSHPAIEPYFGDCPEPVFVKNLENVQGDERDVILFSVGYGPDAEGKKTMSFGPLNRDGGERRLNVAVTRAKNEVGIFSTINSDYIDLSRTKAIGVAHLKAYLEYAERGPGVLGQGVSTASTHDYDSVFEQEVAEALRSSNYIVHTQVGCSGYRIDLGIVDPDKQGRYIVGIECDGATYHRAATARDRDRLRQLVLEGLGWTILRVWSTEWWRDREGAFKRLLAGIQLATKQESRDTVDTNVVAKEKDEPSDSEVDIGDESSIVDNEETPPPVPAEATLAVNYMKRSYKVYETEEYYDPDYFYDPSYASSIRQQISRIVEVEGPIIEDLLVRRVAGLWGFGRIGDKIRQVVSDNLPRELAKTKQFDQMVFWPADLTPDNFEVFRTTNEDDEIPRRVEQLPLEEVANAMRAVLKDYMALPNESLMQEALKAFGWKSLRQSNKEILEAAITRLGDGVTIDGDQINLN